MRERGALTLTLSRGERGQRDSALQKSRFFSLSFSLSLSLSLWERAGVRAVPEFPCALPIPKSLLYALRSAGLDG